MTSIFDGLMVQAVGGNITAPEDLHQATAGLHVDIMDQRIARQVPVGAFETVRHLGGDILVERATERDVDDLHAATDAQGWQIGFQDPVGQGQFELVELGIGLTQFGMRICESLPSAASSSVISIA